MDLKPRERNGGSAVGLQPPGIFRAPFNPSQSLPHLYPPQLMNHHPVPPPLFYPHDNHFIPPQPPAHNYSTNPVLLSSSYPARNSSLPERNLSQERCNSKRIFLDDGSYEDDDRRSDRRREQHRRYKPYHDQPSHDQKTYRDRHQHNERGNNYHADRYDQPRSHHNQERQSSRSRR